MERVRQRLLSLLPYAVGIVLGWLLVFPPDALTALGPWRHLAASLLVLLLLVAFTAAQLAANLPGSLALTPVGEREEGLRELAARLEALGFAPAGPPYEVGLRPPVLMLPFAHEAERAYATVFRTRTLPAKTAFDFVSFLDSEGGSLTSIAEPAGAALPVAPTALRQVFAGADLEEVWRRHREGRDWLRGRGLSIRAVKTTTFAGDFRASFARQRRAFLAAPLRTTVITLWRAVTRRIPERGPLQGQRGVEARVQALLAGHAL